MRLWDQKIATGYVDVGDMLQSNAQAKLRILGGGEEGLHLFALKVKTGFHWARDCRSKTTKDGQPLNFSWTQRPGNKGDPLNTLNIYRDSPSKNETWNKGCHIWRHYWHRCGKNLFEEGGNTCFLQTLPWPYGQGCWRHSHHPSRSLDHPGKIIRAITSPLILLDLPNDLWGRDLLEDMDMVVATDNKAFYADCRVHDKLRMECYPPILMGTDTKELLFSLKLSWNSDTPM